MRVMNVSVGTKAKLFVSGTVLTVKVTNVGQVAIDLQPRQSDVINTVYVSLNAELTEVSECVGSWSVATIKVPTPEQDLVDTGTLDEDGDPLFELQDLPLDMRYVEVWLWGLPESIFNTVVTTEGGTI